MYPKVLQDLIEHLRKLPGVGAKTAERYAFSLLNLNETEVMQMAKALSEAKLKLHPCKTCGNISEKDECDICLDKSRNHQLICVVQDVKDVVAIERTKQYHGVYHVLNGVISTSKGVMPEDLNIHSLIKRAESELDEVILATNPTIEGEATAMYISKLLKGTDILVTRLAHGIPVGGDLEYADEITLARSIENRRTL